MTYLTDLDDFAHTLHANAKLKGFYEPLSTWRSKITSSSNSSN